MNNLDVQLAQHSIINTMKSHIEKANLSGWVVGVSGGVDSALVSTLCAETGKDVLCIEMPIHQNAEHVTRARNHINWLQTKYPNVRSIKVDLTETFDVMSNTLKNVNENISSLLTAEEELALANTRSRLRMTTLYYYANFTKGLVAGTGNKVEDFGVGFFTKGGDGVVDISPIGDLYKSEVVEMARNLGVLNEILNATPSDGLWADSRSDEEQIGASYPELEWAMKFIELENISINHEESSKKLIEHLKQHFNLTDRECEVLYIYRERHSANQHKMNKIPVCKVGIFRN